MPERQRAYRDGKLVTVLSGKIGGRGKVTIRNQFGFTEVVGGKELSKVENDSARAKLKFGSPED